MPEWEPVVGNLRPWGVAVVLEDPRRAVAAESRSMGTVEARAVLRPSGPLAEDLPDFAQRRDGLQAVVAVVRDDDGAAGCGQVLGKLKQPLIPERRRRARGAAERFAPSGVLRSVVAAMPRAIYAVPSLFARRLSVDRIESTRRRPPSRAPGAARRRRGPKRMSAYSRRLRGPPSARPPPSPSSPGAASGGCSPPALASEKKACSARRRKGLDATWQRSGANAAHACAARRRTAAISGTQLSVPVCAASTSRCP